MDEVRPVALFSSAKECDVSAGSLIRSTWLLYFSQPAPDRFLYKAVKGKSIRSVVEIGIGSGLRTQRMLDVLTWRRENLPLRYTGIDLFEARVQHQAGLTLKAAFHNLRRPGVQLKLVPGDPYDALVRAANGLGGTDLLIISADQDRFSLQRAWTYMPRMLHTDSLIFQEDGDSITGKTSYRRLTLLDVQRNAAIASRAMRRAA
jgi:predicted O-methyltransferase YrrM